MRKYISWIVSAVFIILALLVPNGGVSAIAGAGTGNGMKITKVKQVGELLADFSEKAGMTPTAVKEREASIEAMSTLSATEKYHSVTLSVDTTASIISNSSKHWESNYGNNTMRASQSSSSQVDITRSMDCYFTENEAFYVVEATINNYSHSSGSSNYNDEYQSYNNEIDWDLSLAFELYVGEDEQLIKITRWGAKYYTVSGEEWETDENPYTIPEGIINNWVDAAEFGDTIVSANVFNYQILSIFGEYILEVDGDKFVKSGDCYSLKPAKVKELCTQICEIEKGFGETEFSVDLSNAKKPFINFLYTVDFSDSSDSYSLSYKGGEWTTIAMSNINDTVINFPEDVTIYSMEDFE